MFGHLKDLSHPMSKTIRRKRTKPRRYVKLKRFVEVMLDHQNEPFPLKVGKIL